MPRTQGGELVRFFLKKIHVQEQRVPLTAVLVIGHGMCSGQLLMNPRQLVFKVLDDVF
jgi:hypothetical protein